MSGLSSGKPTIMTVLRALFLKSIPSKNEPDITPNRLSFLHLINCVSTSFFSSVVKFVDPFIISLLQSTYVSTFFLREYEGKKTALPPGV